MNVLCPIDHIFVEIGNDGWGRCPQCNKIWQLPLIEVAMRCEHRPQPLQGYYRFRGVQVEYSYCSWECKERLEADYGGRLMDLGLQ